MIVLSRFLSLPESRCICAVRTHNVGLYCHESLLLINRIREKRTDEQYDGANIGKEL